MPSQALDDAQLLADTAQDPAAFVAFYERYEEAVLLFMLRRTATPELAADLTAEVFAAALEGADGFRFTGVPPAAWLFRIARNILVDSYRKARVQNDVRQRLGMAPLHLSDEIDEHLERLAARAEGAIAVQLLCHLPEDQRAVVIAHVIEDRDYADIASELQCSQSVVRKRVSRGLRALRHQLTTGENHA